MSKVTIHLLDIIIAVSAASLGYFVNEYVRLSQDVIEEASRLNITGTLNTSVLIFNRTPKTGSESIFFLLNDLSKVNGFTAYTTVGELDKTAEDSYLPTLIQRKNYVESFDRQSLPYSFSKHSYFVNFEEFNVTNPIYINFIRDPIERIISWYYYTRQSWYLIHPQNATEYRPMEANKLTPKSLKMSFEDCVSKAEDECQYIFGDNIIWPMKGGAHKSQIPYFCGMDDECITFGSTKALQKAMTNVDRYFAVVGILENMQESLQVLENYVPAFFKNARFLHSQTSSHDNKNKVKPMVSKEIKDLVRSNFTTEIEFYQYCKQRLWKQYLTSK